MKTLGTLLLVLFATLSINSQEFKFEQETIDYGKIIKAQKEKEHLSLQILEMHL